MLLKLDAPHAYPWAIEVRPQVGGRDAGLRPESPRTRASTRRAARSTAPASRSGTPPRRGARSRPALPATPRTPDRPAPHRPAPGAPRPVAARVAAAPRRWLPCRRGGAGAGEDEVGDAPARSVVVAGERHDDVSVGRGHGKLWIAGEHDLQHRVATRGMVGLDMDVRRRWLSFTAVVARHHGDELVAAVGVGADRALQVAALQLFGVVAGSVDTVAVGLPHVQRGAGERGAGLVEDGPRDHQRLRRAPSWRRCPDSAPASPWPPRRPRRPASCGTDRVAAAVVEDDAGATVVVVVVAGAAPSPASSHATRAATSTNHRAGRAHRSPSELTPRRDRGSTRVRRTSALGQVWAWR